MHELKTQINRIFMPDGLLAARLPGHEPRPGQVKMALAVAEALNGGLLAVEAETGIGKTLAYLIPAALSRQKVVVSTNTINLQEQILAREIPFIQRHIDPELSALCVKGRQNYLCLYRWQQFIGSAQQQLFAEEEHLERIKDWLAETDTGDRAELPWLADDASLWREIDAAAAKCLGSSCPVETDCFINRLRKKAAAAQILIVNHHLFFSDLALRRAGFGEVLPRYESVIFDEAHHIENVASSYFGISFSHYQIIDLLNDIDILARAELGRKDHDRLSQAAGALIRQAEDFASIFPGNKGRFTLDNFIVNEPAWETRLNALTDHLARFGERLHTLAGRGEIWSAMGNRCTELLTRLVEITNVTGDAAGPDDSYVRWYERREKTVALAATPVEIASVLQEFLYHKCRSCIFTSATLTVGGEFDYYLEQMGLPRETETLSLPSPFDYAGRTLLYIPGHGDDRDFPEPGSSVYFARMSQRIKDILLASNGRALVLFTSIQAMNAAHAFLQDLIPHPLLIQGQAPRNTLLETFQRETDSVLLAVSSFWEGINVPGKSLSCVIIDKLPFAVPSDPVIMARINRIKLAGGNPFFDFQVPRAILALRQGVGRLMRASSDKGLLAILDVRLYKKSYGRLFLASLPPSPVTRHLEDVKLFFADRHDDQTE